MNEDMQKKLLGYLEMLEAGAKRAGEFAETEVPATIREYLAWRFYESCGWATIYLTLFVVFLLTARYFATLFWRWAGETDDSDLKGWLGFFSVLSRIAQGLSSLFILLGFVPNCLTAVKVSVAPRVVLLEDAAKMVGVGKPEVKK